MIKLTIPGRLPSLNEYIAAERTNRYKAAAMKRDAEELIQLLAKTQLRGVKFTEPVHISYLWVEANKKRDKDNVAFAKKFIQDALVKAGVLSGDGWSCIEGFSDSFAVGDPHVEVTIRGQERQVLQREQRADQSAGKGRVESHDAGREAAQGETQRAVGKSADA